VGIRVSRGQRGGSLTVVNLSFLDWPILFCQVASHLSSQGLRGPRSRPTATQENVVAPGIKPRTSGLAARYCDRYTTETVTTLHLRG
jgi:hypothetical protein